MLLLHFPVQCVMWRMNMLTDQEIQDGRQSYFQCWCNRPSKHCRLLALAFMGMYKTLLLRNCVEAKSGKIPCSEQKEVFEVNTWSEFVPRRHFFLFRARKIWLFPRTWLRSYQGQNEKSIWIYHVAEFTEISQV